MWLLRTCLILVTLFVGDLSLLADEVKEGNKLWYKQPAKEWSQALPIGNGRLGAMVYGGVQQERLQLNEDTLWCGGPRSYDNKEAFQHLGAVRKLLDDGEYAKAEELAGKMMGKPLYQMAYQPLCVSYKNDFLRYRCLEEFLPIFYFLYYGERLLLEILPSKF